MNSSPTIPSFLLLLHDSIGSLGSSSSQACVYNVFVSNCQLADLQNGLRIKTYQGGMGSVYNVRYSNVTLSNVANPIYITQVCSCAHSSRAMHLYALPIRCCITARSFYCIFLDWYRVSGVPKPTSLCLCSAQFYCDKTTFSSCATDNNGLAIFNISYYNVTGTSNGTRGIVFNCSDTVPCQQLSVKRINIVASSSSSLKNLFHNAYGTSSNVVSPVTSGVTWESSPITSSESQNFASQIAKCG